MPEGTEIFSPELVVRASTSPATDGQQWASIDTQRSAR